MISCFQLNQTISTVLIVSSNRVESWHLALRAVGSKPLSQILQVGSRTSGRNGASGLSSSGDLNALLNLDLPLRTESVEEMKKRSIMAVFYLIILQMTGKLGLKLIIFFTHFYSFLLTFTHFYSFLLFFTHFYSFLLIFTHFYSFSLISSHFYSFLLIFTLFHSFLLIFTHFHSFLLIFTHFHSFLLIFGE